jgi:hypothetical protein
MMDTPLKETNDWEKKMSLYIQIFVSRV